MKWLNKADKTKKRGFSRFVRVVVKLALAVVIFCIGIMIGQGRIHVGFLLPRASENKNLPANLDYSSVEQVYDLLRDNFDGKLDQGKLLDGLKAGLVNAGGDPYTEYLSPKQAQDFNGELNGSFTGIGAELAKDDSKNIIVVAPISGFPAEKAGLKPKDIIAEIDGKSAYDLSLSDAVDKIRGPKDTVVKLKIVRDGKQQLDVSITRQEITIPSVKSEKLDNGIGIIHIARFAEDTSDLAQKAADDFKQSGIKAVILDVRSDPGGLLDAAVNVSSLWLQNKTVLQEKRGNVVEHTYKSEGMPTLAGLPTVVLIDGGSASASEITAGALKDNGVATLMGVKSFGKGSVQQLQKLSGGGVLKVTIARWYTPNGKNIDKEGIEPDKKVDLTQDDFTNGRDPQKAAAIEFLKSKIQ